MSAITAITTVGERAMHTFIFVESPWTSLVIYRGSGRLEV
jgi:hypothetical protein